MLPEKFMEQSIRVYCRKTDPDSIKAAKKLVTTVYAVYHFLFESRAAVS